MFRIKGWISSRKEPVESPPVTHLDPIAHRPAVGERAAGPADRSMLGFIATPGAIASLWLR